MSTRSRPTREIIQAADDGELVALGEYAARDDRTGLKLRMPTTAQESVGADVGDSFECWFDQDSGGLVFLPAE